METLIPSGSDRMAKIRKLREFEQGVVMTSGADESQAWCAVRQYDSPKAICSCIHSLHVDSFQSPPEPARFVYAMVVP